MHTLTVNGRNQKGKKDSGDSVLVYNVDNVSAFASQATFHKGVAKLSVPEGHYAAFSFFFDGTTVRGSRCGSSRSAATPRSRSTPGRRPPPSRSRRPKTGDPADQ
jgi:hypothetical protein